MTKVVITISSEVNDLKPGIILRSDASFVSQALEIVPNKSIAEVKSEDESLAQQLLKINEVDISFLPSGFYLSKGEPRILPFRENRRHIGLAEPTEKEFGVYELCLKILEYNDMILEKRYYAISSCCVMYHFPENRQADYSWYKQLKIKKCVPSMSKIFSQVGSTEWFTIVLRNIGDRDELYAHAGTFQKSLIKIIENSWKEIFTNAADLRNRELGTLKRKVVA